MRTAIVLAALLTACASTPPVDGPPDGWLDVGAGPMPLERCSTWTPITMTGPVHSLGVRAAPYRLDVDWQPGSHTLSYAQYDDCPVEAGISRCTPEHPYHVCEGTISEGADVWIVDVTCEDGAHVVAEVTSCVRG